ncbi:putative polysaccharide biosynthesis protein [Marinicrinis sediminis]|uniref:Oligosaccharide flippase family protein n=1 Tax=Marinicrinis sediminis TaxID=1652465 RepID=A0ABW5R7E6_9BACL
MSKDSLIKGTIILAGAAFVARFLGLLQRVPLQNMLGDEGMASYGLAYNIYFLLLIVATAGIPSALSKLVSEKLALDQVEEANRIYRAAVYFALTAGVVITALLYVGAPFYATHVAEIEEAAWAIRALAPAMLLFPLIAIMRGYFQGHQQMMPGGLSQIVEQILRVVTAVVLVYLLLSWDYSLEWAAAGASFGGVMGAAGAFAVMLFYGRRHRKKRLQQQAQMETSERAEHTPMSYRSIYKAIFRLSIPISLISLAVPMIYFIDSSIIVPLLKGDLGMEEAKDVVGILTGRAQSLAGIPPIMAIALSMSIVPVVSSAYAKKDMAEVNRKASQALRISVLSGLPLVLILALAARPINGLLFTDLEGTAIMAWMTVSSMFQILMMTSSAILMGMGLTKAPMLNVGVGIVVKLVGSYGLAPYFGIFGIIVSTMACFIVTMLLNLMVLRKTVRYHVLGKRWPGTLLTTALLVGAGIVLERTAFATIATDWIKLDYFLNGLITGASLMLLYPVLMWVTKAFRPEDVQMLPARIQRLLRPVLNKLGVKQIEKGK